jgi:putative chitinase
MISITSAQLAQLAPKCIDVYKQTFAAADTVLQPYGINNTALRLSHFMAQVLHESGALTICSENLNYRADRLMAVWPKRFPTLDVAQSYEHNPQKLANYVYGGRMGNTDPDDGWKYIGRGLIQITGRESYRKFGKLLGVDLEANPELAVSADWALKIAAEEWKAGNCNAKADADDIVGLTKIINGGIIGLPERKAWLVKTKAVWPS